MAKKSKGDWYAVRCVFESGWPSDDPGTLYEERITLWQAGSADDAIALAEAEALEYAASVEEYPDRYLGLAQAYHLFEDPAHGAEIFSLVRSSDLDDEEYLDTFFDTGQEHERQD